MGACGSSATPEQKAALKASQELDKKNAGEWAKDNQKIKLLLLGAGESGKSTIFKQVSFVHFLARSWRAPDPGPHHKKQTQCGTRSVRSALVASCAGAGSTRHP